MELLKKGYYLSGALFVLTCLIFFYQQMINNLQLFHPDTGPTAIFELSCIVYNLVFVAVQSLVVGHLCGCPYNKKSITFVAIFTICTFLFTVWVGTLIASILSNPRSFLRIGIFCLISLVQTILLPTVIYFNEPTDPKTDDDNPPEIGYLTQKRLSRTASSIRS